MKALVRNLTKGDSMQAQIIMRNYVMERFLERISLSKYKNNFILKGGMLVSAMVGLDIRSTMDIDTTIKKYASFRRKSKRNDRRNYSNSN